MRDYTLLLIDYEPKSIEQVSAPLLKAGYKVEVAHDGLSGLEAFRRLQPELVLIEAMIPKKHGFEVCQEIKKSPQGKRTRVVILTGVYKGRKYRSQAIHLYGCDEYLEKPVEDATLVTVCRRFLGDPAESGAQQQRKTGTDGARPAAGPRLPVADPTMSPPTGRMPIADLTEEEIMATLNAILPGVEADAPPAAPGDQTETIPMASAAPEPMAPLEEAEPTTEGSGAEVTPDAGEAAEPETSSGSRVIDFDAARARKQHADEEDKEEDQEETPAEARKQANDAEPAAEAVEPEPEPSAEAQNAEPPEAAAKPEAEPEKTPTEGVGEEDAEEATAEDAPVGVSEDIAEAELDAALDMALSRRGDRSQIVESVMPLTEAEPAPEADSSGATPPAETEAETKQERPAASAEPKTVVEAEEPTADTTEPESRFQPAAAAEWPAASKTAARVEPVDAMSLQVTDHRGLPGWVWPAVIAAAAIVILGLVFLVPRGESGNVIPEAAVAQGAQETPSPVPPAPREAPAPESTVAAAGQQGQVAPARPGIAQTSPEIGKTAPVTAPVRPKAEPKPVKGALVEKTSGNRLQPRMSEPVPRAQVAKVAPTPVQLPPGPKQSVPAAPKTVPPTAGTASDLTAGASTKPSAAMGLSGPGSPPVRETLPERSAQGVAQQVEATGVTRVKTPAAPQPETPLTSPAQGVPRPTPAAATPTGEQVAPQSVAPGSATELSEPQPAVVPVSGSQPKPLPVPVSPAPKKTAPEALAPPPVPAPPAPKPVRRGDLVDLGDVDGPPKPIRRDLPRYPLRARQLRQNGSVLLRILIDETGKVTDVKLIRGIEGSDLNDAAIQAVRNWTFRPAVKSGVPVKVWKVEKIVFKF